MIELVVISNKGSGRLAVAAAAAAAKTKRTQCSYECGKIIKYLQKLLFECLNPKTLEQFKTKL